VTGQTSSIPTTPMSIVKCPPSDIAETGVTAENKTS